MSRTCSSCSTCSTSNDRPSHLPEAWRLFVAAPLPEDAAAAVWDALASTRDRFPDTRWIVTDLLHLTLVFMGQVESGRVPAINETLAAVVLRHAAFQNRIDGAGGHVDDRPGARPGGVAWLTLGEGFRQTADLSLEMDQELGSHTYDRRRSPRPHLTVARAVDAAALAALRDLAPALSLEWRTTSVALFRSHLGPGGSHYEPLGIHGLAQPR